MINWSVLDDLPREILDKIAKDLNLSELAGGPRNHLTDAIIQYAPEDFDLAKYIPKKKPQPVSPDESSSFVTENSSFVSQEPEEDQSSSFIQPEDHPHSEFIQPQDQPHSEFLRPEDQSQSQFVQTETTPHSEFIQPDDSPRSEFLKPGDGSPSQFILPENLEEIGKKTASSAHNLSVGDRIVLNNQPYDIVRIISESSREAVIYEVKDSKSFTFVLKLYKAHKHASEEPNAESLSRIQAINNPDILKLYDFGTGAKKFQQKYCFEISALARGGNLLDVKDFKKKYSKEFLENNLIPEVFKGIRTLHNKKIYHCDLKPQNIFFLDEAQTDLVIGDYGSSKTFEEQSSRAAQQFDSVIATNAYMAPEQANRIISEKVDYYAFGMVLVHLLYPEYFTRDDNHAVVDKEKSRLIREKQYTQEEILPFDSRFHRINQLIGGLTLYNHNSRWGEKEIEKWIRNEHVEVIYKGQSLIKPINIAYPGMPAIRTQKELIYTIENFPDQWYEDLIVRNSGFNALIDWFASRYDLQVARVFEQMITFYKKQGKAYVKEAICRYFEPERPLITGGQTYRIYDNPNVWQEVVRFLGDLDNRWKKSSVADMRLAIFMLEFSLRQFEPNAGEQAAVIRNYLDSTRNSLGTEQKNTFADYITTFQNVISLAENETESALRQIVLIIYLVNLKRPFKDLENRPIEKLEDVAFYFARNPEHYKNLQLTIEKDFFLHLKQKPDLVGLDLREFLFGVFAEQTQTQIQLNSVKVNKDREYTSTYTYQKSLTNFLKQQNIKAQLDEGGNKKPLAVRQKTRLFQFAPGVFNQFLQYVQTNHKIADKAIIPENRNKIKRKFVSSALFQNFGHHIKELLAALALMIPVFGIIGLFAIPGNSGYPLIGEIFREVRLADYIENPEQNFDDVGGFSLMFFVFAAMYLLALIPKIWAGKDLELAGSTKPNTPRMLSISGGTGFSFLAFMFMYPIFLIVTNWLYELIGISAILTMAFFFFTRSGGKAKSKGRVIAFLLLFQGLIRLGLEAYAWNEAGSQMDTVIAGRGLADVMFYLIAMVVFFVPPIWYQMFQAHNRLQLAIKTGILFLAGIIFLNVSGLTGGIYNFPGFSFGNSSNRSVEETPIPNVWLGKITSDLQGMNLRSGPGTNHSVVSVIKSDDIFQVEQGVTGAWWKVRVCDGNEGYLYSSKIQLLQNITPTQLQEFLNGAGPCSSETVSVEPNPVADLSAPLVAQTNFSGTVGKLDARFQLNSDADNRINGAYYYPNRNDGQIYNLVGSVLPDNKLEIFEFTGNIQSASCMLTYNQASGCYQGQMKNTDGRVLDMRVCGQKFSHPASIQSDTAPTDAFTARIRGSNVNIRDLPSADNSRVIHRLDNGDRVLVVGSETETGGNTLVTDRKSILYTASGESYPLPKGKILFLQSQQPSSGKYYVATNLSGNTLTEGYVSILDVSMTDGKTWYKIRFGANQEGWVYEDFLRK
ncbi:MAG: SH3 domain-containing protein [Bacteroidia bacterium]